MFICKLWFKARKNRSLKNSWLVNAFRSIFIDLVSLARSYNFIFLFLLNIHLLIILYLLHLLIRDHLPQINILIYIFTALHVFLVACLSFIFLVSYYFLCSNREKADCCSSWILSFLWDLLLFLKLSTGTSLITALDSWLNLNKEVCCFPSFPWSFFFFSCDGSFNYLIKCWAE